MRSSTVMWKASGIALIVTSLVACSTSPSPAGPELRVPSSPAPRPPSSPTPTWSDEFDGVAGAVASPQNWTYETGGGGWGNEELQYYTDSTDNASLDGHGNLTITTRQIDPNTTALQCWYGPCSFTSARLTTQHRQEFQYGRIESRLRVPEGGGIWPALWMLGTDINEVGWPQTGEIDIMEYVGRSPDEVFGTLHGPGYSGGQAFSGVRDLGGPLNAEWHVLTLDWSPDLFVWSIDGDEFHRATSQDVAPDEWVFDHAFFLLTNVAVGGNFGGALGADVSFPQTLTIDYIRVFDTSGTD